MKCFSLFSGIGCFDLALQRKGYEVVGACEIDKFARQVYAEHFPGIKIWEDATEIQPEQLPDFDLLCAGFPCQSFSIAGKQRGFSDTRGTLFYEIARIIKEKRPKILLLENVGRLLTHDEGETYRTILSTLDELGYDAEWQMLDSRYFVPQSRKRIFIIGHLREKPFTQVLPIGEIHDVPNEKSTTYLPSLTASDHKGPSKQRISNIIVEEAESQKANTT